MPLNQWHRIHPGHPAFICRWQPTAEDGECPDEEFLLAMNAELANSTGVKLPEGISPFNLKKTGKKADLFREVAGATARTERGKTRVIVLAQKLTAYLLEDISEAVVGKENCHPDSGADGDDVAAEGGRDDSSGRDDSF